MTVPCYPAQQSNGRLLSTIVLSSAILLALCNPTRAVELRAGAAKVDITDRDAGPVNDPLYVKALVIERGATKAVIVTVDAVAIGEIGRIGNDYLPSVREAIEKSLEIPATNLFINASHCHGVVCDDVTQRTVDAITTAAGKLEAVRVGVGHGHEDRIMENRRLLMNDGREIDVRHAYSMPPDKEVARVGPVDPEIGVLRIDRLDGTPLAAVYNFACHPIQGVPGRRNTADLVGFASRAIEEVLGDGAVALFVQGCGGDINPVFYKDVDHPRSAEPLGNLLGLSTLRSYKQIVTGDDDRLTCIQETLALPRADLGEKIIAMESQRDRLAASFTGTTLSLKTFVPLYVKHGISGDFPAYYSHRYMQEQSIGSDALRQLDQENRAALQQYVRNVERMEQLTRMNTNLALLRKHHAQNLAAGKRTVDVELLGLRIGEFVMTSFPGELTVQIGLNIKRDSPHEHTFVAGYTNGYIYYAPTTDQLKNVGGAQEDSDCILAPHWQPIYERKAAEILNRL